MNGRKKFFEREKALQLREEEFERTKLKYSLINLNSNNNSQRQELGKIEISMEVEKKTSVVNQNQDTQPKHLNPYLEAKDGTRVIYDDPWLEPFKDSLRERYKLDYSLNNLILDTKDINKRKSKLKNSKEALINFLKDIRNLDSIEQMVYSIY